MVRSYSRNSGRISDEIETGRSGATEAAISATTRSWRPFAWALSRHTVSASTPVRDQLLDGVANGRLVDRLDDRAVGAHPLGHLAHVAGVGERLGLLVDHEAEQRPRRPRLGEVEDLPEALA